MRHTDTKTTRQTLLEDAARITRMAARKRGLPTYATVTAMTLGELLDENFSDAEHDQLDQFNWKRFVADVNKINKEQI